jgi:hypothetical protein
MARHGTWIETGGGDSRMPLLIILAVVVAALLGGGAATGLISAVTVLLYWVAGIMIATVVGGGAFLVLTRDRRARKNLEFAKAKELQRKRYYAEVDARNERKAIVAANANVRAMAPYAALIAEALRGNSPQPAPEPAYTMRAEVVKIGDKEVEPR